MTIEEFYHTCKNCTFGITLEIWSFHSLVALDTFESLPRRIQNLHVQSFQVLKGKVIIYVRECVR